MNNWNQWAAAGTATPGYPLGAYPAPQSTATLPTAAAALSAPTASVPAAVPYGAVAGFQWPYAAAGAQTVNPWGPTAAASTTQQQQQAQWEQWSQWHQQYQQWQQYAQATGATSVPPPIQPPLSQTKLALGVTSQSSISVASTGVSIPAYPSAPATSTTVTPSSVAPPIPSAEVVKRAGGEQQQAPDAKKSRVELSSSGGWSQSTGVAASGPEQPAPQPTSESTPTSTPSKETLEELSEAEKQFDEQFKNWEAQFDAWRQQNANHPDTEQYKAYEAKWASWKEQLLTRREQMKKKREKLEAQKAQQAAQLAAQQATAVAAAAAVAATQQNPSAAKTTEGAVPPLVPPQMYSTQYQGVANPYSQYQQPFMGFSMAPPPVMPPVAASAIPSQLTPTPVNTTPGLGTNDKPSEQPQPSGRVGGDFLKTSVPSGIPGLDLLSEGGPKKDLDVASIAFSNASQVPIQTPADSKPFDFPPPKGQSNYPFNQMSMPPPNMGVPPPNIALNKPPGLLDNYDRKTQEEKSFMMPPNRPPPFPGGPCDRFSNIGDNFGPDGPGAGPKEFGLGQQEFGPGGPREFPLGAPRDFPPGGLKDIRGPAGFTSDKFQGIGSKQPDKFGPPSFPPSVGLLGNRPPLLDERQGPNKFGDDGFNKDKRGWTDIKHVPLSYPSPKKGFFPMKELSVEEEYEQFHNYVQASEKDTRDDKLGDFDGDQRMRGRSGRDDMFHGRPNDFRGPGGNNRGGLDSVNFRKDSFRPGGGDSFHSGIKDNSRSDHPDNFREDKFRHSGGGSDSFRSGPDRGRDSFGRNDRNSGGRPFLDDFDQRNKQFSSRSEGPREELNKPQDRFPGGPNFMRNNDNMPPRGFPEGMGGPRPGLLGEGRMDVDSRPRNFGGPGDDLLGHDKRKFEGIGMDRPFSRGGLPDEFSPSRIPKSSPFGMEGPSDRPPSYGEPRRDIGNDGMPPTGRAGRPSRWGNAEEKEDVGPPPGGPPMPGLLGPPPVPPIMSGPPPPGDKPTNFFETIIDYQHKPADLGVPEMFEPVSIIDYTHSLNGMKILETPKPKPSDQGNSWGGRGPRSRDSPNSPWQNKSYSPYSEREEGDDRGKWGSRSSRWEREGRGSPDRRSERSRSGDDSRRSDSRRYERDEKRGSRDSYDKRRRSRSPIKKMSPPPRQSQSQNQNPQPVEPAITLIDDILLPPGRNTRPEKVAVFLRGPPGSGKSYVAKLIKDKELEKGGTAPRILSLDDYFITEVEKVEKDESGKTVSKKVMEYEFENNMESKYRESLSKTFRKTITNGYFPFIIVDANNEKMSHFELMVNFAGARGFQCYVVELDMDVNTCFKRNIHKRTEKDIENIVKDFEKTPPGRYHLLDVRSLLQSAVINEVDMEESEGSKEVEVSEEPKETELKKKEDDDSVKEDDNANEQKEKKDETNEESDSPKESSGPPKKMAFGFNITSKWDDLDSSVSQLDRLDGFAKGRKPRPTIQEWLQDTDDSPLLDASKPLDPTKKRVRWADLEARRHQEKMKALGFVVGQTDWSSIINPSAAHTKLTQTKYI